MMQRHRGRARVGQGRSRPTRMPASWAMLVNCQSRFITDWISGGKHDLGAVPPRLASHAWPCLPPIAATVIGRAQTGTSRSHQVCSSPFVVSLLFCPAPCRGSPTPQEHAPSPQALSGQDLCGGNVVLAMLPVGPRCPVCTVHTPDQRTVAENSTASAWSATQMPLAWSVGGSPSRQLPGPNRGSPAWPGLRLIELALAMAAGDTVLVAAACPAAGRAVLVVTDDPAAASTLSALGAGVVADEPDDGLNPALAHGAAAGRGSRPDCGTAALAADPPAPRPAELDGGVRAAAQWPEAFVPDSAQGTPLPLGTRPALGSRLAALRPGLGGARPGRAVPPRRADRRAQPALGRGHARLPWRPRSAWGSARGQAGTGRAAQLSPGA